MKKLILILFIPFFLTGCASVSYNLNIEKNLSVEEEVFMSATSEYFALFYKNYPKTIVKESLDNEETMAPLKNNKYSYELVTKNVAYPGILAKKTYSSLDEYTKNTVFKGQSFEDIISGGEDNLITIKTVNFLPYVDDQTDIRYPISNVSIHIKLPYVVTEHNADKYNAKTNTYTWYIDKKTTEKEIQITFDKSKIYVYNLVMYISMFILCLLVIGLIFVIKRIVDKNRRNNQIIE